MGMLSPDARVYVAGHRGMVGSAIWRALEAQGFANLIGWTSSEVDLTDRDAAMDAVRSAQPDVVVVSTRQKVIGTSPDRHDLSGLTEPLRSHGGITEQRVPMIANRPITVPQGRTLRNFDVFDVAVNLVN